MKKVLHPLLLLVFLSMKAFATSDTLSIEQADSIISHQTDSIEASFKWQTGEISIGDGMAKLIVPKGYKYLDAKQTNYVLHDLWGNPEAETYGMLFEENDTPLSENGWDMSFPLMLLIM